MKKRFVLLLFVAFSSVAGDFPAFMTGSWKSISADGSISEEQWMSARGGLMLGLGRTVGKDGQLKSFEFMRIESKDGRLAFLSMPGGRPATSFPLASLGASRAVFENPDHDFPQRIIYWKKGSRLCAQIEGTIGGKLERESWCWSKQ